jgi:epoxyqueuosine reductase
MMLRINRVCDSPYRLVTITNKHIKGFTPKAYLCISMFNNSAKYSQLIKAEAMRLGFMSCGISKATFLEEEALRLEKWLNNNHHGEMAYMENHFDKRLDPRLLVEGAKSVVSLTLNYFTEQKQTDFLAPKISKYAYGADYHSVIKEKLKLLLAFINDEIGEVGGRCFVDSAPVMDKAWAQKSGLGWRGKNSNLISRDAGSFFFLAELIIDLELEYDTPFATDHCGSCTRCIDACPTDAIVAPYVVDGSKCISYLTIELKNEIPNEFKGKMENWMFGCDICQDVCPWNRFSIPHQENAFAPGEELLHLTKSELTEITDDVFRQVFKNSAVKRTKFAGLKRNIEFLR